MRVGVVKLYERTCGCERVPIKTKKETAVAIVIEFYVPDNFRRRVKWVSPERRGKILEFGAKNSVAAPAGAGAADLRISSALEMVVLS